MKKSALALAVSAMAISAMVSSVPAQAQSNAFIGQISMYGANFCPRNWATTDGQLLAISQNTALFSLLGTQYGGNGTTNFALPNLQGSTPIGVGAGPGLTSRVQGEEGGTETEALVMAEMPAHTHVMAVRVSNTVATANAPVRNYLAQHASGANVYNNATTTEFAKADTIRVDPAGANQAFSIRSPYLAVTFCIALTGVFPARS